MVDPGNVEEVCALDPDFIGYIFHLGSKRFVGHRPDPSLFRIPGPQTARVGVFVNEELSEVLRKFDMYMLDLVQLHGSEPPGYCGQLVEQGIPVIKVIHAGYQDPDAGQVKFPVAPEQYHQVAHFLLLDSGASGTGGSGRKFDWALLGELRLPVPFILGGGIGPEDAGPVSRLDDENLYGVDLNSRFEVEPGIKDVRLLNKFIVEIRSQGENQNNQK